MSGGGPRASPGFLPLTWAFLFVINKLPFTVDRRSVEVYAIVRLAQRQVMVKPEEYVRVPRLDVTPGSLISCDDVLFYADGDDVRVGRPLLDGIKVTAEVLDHLRDDKIIVFKMKRRKKYRRKRGHRQDYTLLKIKEISA